MFLCQIEKEFLRNDDKAAAIDDVQTQARDCVPSVFRAFFSVSSESARWNVARTKTRR